MILITGGNGQLGTELRHLLDERGMAYTATDAKELDITDKVAVDTFFDKTNLNLFITAQLIQLLIKPKMKVASLMKKINVDGTKMWPKQLHA